MGPKKRGKKKGEPKPKITKTQYLTMIAESNAVLAQERRKIDEVLECYLNSEKKYDQIQVDMADILKYLQHEIEGNDSEISTFNEKIDKLNKELKQTDKHYESIFNKMESEYEQKYTTMQLHIQQINAKLFASEETRQQREEYFKKKAELETIVKEMEIRQESEIYEAEKLAIIKQDTMQKSMETHLISLVVDFRQASDLAIGETINKLVRDNIALSNMLTCMQETIENARESYQAKHAEEIHYKYDAELIDEEYNKIIKRNDARIRTIESLIKCEEELNERIKNCQKLIKNNRRLQRQIAEEECSVRQKSKEVKNLVKILKEHESFLISGENAFDVTRKEVIRLVNTIFEGAKKVKEAIDIDNVTHLDDDLENENKEELEENLIDFKLKFRQSAIDEIVNKFSAELSSITDPQLLDQPSESNLTCFYESILTV